MSKIKMTRGGDEIHACRECEYRGPASNVCWATSKYIDTALFPDWCPLPDAEKGKKMNESPTKLWLQWIGEEPDNPNYELSGEDGPTWSEKKVNDTDIKYIREDWIDEYLFEKARKALGDAEGSGDE